MRARRLFTILEVLTVADRITVLVSAELDEVMGLSDTIGVLYGSHRGHDGGRGGRLEPDRPPDGLRRGDGGGLASPMTARGHGRRAVGVYRRLAPVTVPLLAVLTTLVVAGAAVVAAGSKPVEAYSVLIEGAFGSWGRLATTVGRAAPFVGTALAMAFVYKAGLFNIRVEGQILAGAMLAAWVGTWSWLRGWPGSVLVVLAAGTLGGLVWGLMPGVLKARTGAHEVITTSMINFIMAVSGPWSAWRGPGRSRGARAASQPHPQPGGVPRAVGGGAGHQGGPRPLRSAPPVSLRDRGRRSLLEL